MRFLMCEPKFFDINYEINPWMSVAKKANPQNVKAQWQQLYQTMRACGADIELIEPQPNLPDMVFTANAGLYYKNNIVLSHFKHKERQEEAKFFAQWFKNNNFALLNKIEQTPPYFEGAGDALIAGQVLFAGYGFRTDKKFFEQEKYFEQDKIIYCELADPYYYHIDTCFCPLNAEQAIWYPHAFTQSSKNDMQKAIELIPVTEEEAKLFACNAVVINNHIILPERTSKITASLSQLGFNVHHCQMDEFLKSGGACKCLTMRID